MDFAVVLDVRRCARQDNEPSAEKYQSKKFSGHFPRTWKPEQALTGTTLVPSTSLHFSKETINFLFNRQKKKNHTGGFSKFLKYE